ncbi:MAG: LytTR family DNA-binding domain-containing protein [Bacteroidales bacterium]|nr:LytTR family DNA-binding domain-containing protein [Bacteroidales bacterium]MDD3166358.1 LytTR family DNA-binding domain-containing protein [Bacteroidales bacterium]MDD4770877.1 LytTR family DNA-binding domain-containing protein [Bacteroidales bacterium]
MITCIAVDDEPLAIEIIEAYEQQIPGLVLKQTFTDAISAWSYLSQNPVDLVFLDIQMPDISGLQLARSLSKHKPMIVFTTAYGKFAVDGFDLEAVDYLLKPFTFDRFNDSIRKANTYKMLQQSKHLKEEDKGIYVKSDYRNIRISLHEILYIEGYDDYIRIHLDDGKTITTLMSLKSILEKLPSKEFVRIHRSYIVATHKIKRIYQQKVQLPSVELHIGKTYLSAVNKLTL